MRSILIIALASITVACANVPKVGELGEGISATGALFRGAVTASRTVALGIGEENQAYELLNGQPFTLADRPAAMLAKVRTDVRIEALKALEAYGDALAKAADQGMIDKLEQASVKLGDAAAGVVGATSPVPSPLVAPGFKVISRGIGFLLGNAYASEIHAVVVSQNDNIKTLAAVLKQDMNAISDFLKTQAKDFETARKRNVVHVRNDPGVDSLRLYHEFKAARQDASAINALTAAAANYNEVLDNLVEAHDAIATARPDAELALRRFVALTNDLVVLVNAAKKEKPE